MNNGGTFSNTFTCYVKSHSAAYHGSHRIVEALSALRHRNYRLYWLGQLSSVLAQNIGGDRPELVSIGAHQLAAVFYASSRARLCHPNYHIDSPRRRHRRWCQPTKTHHDFFPTRFGFQLLHPRHSGNRRMDRLVACHDLGLFIGLHQSL